MADQIFDLFISHNSDDKPFIDVLAKRLNDEYDINAWLDKWSLVAAADWAPAIEKALRSCAACAVVLGAKGWGPHHLGEAQLALKHKREFPDFRVIPVLLPGASVENMKVLGDFFEQVHRVDFVEGQNPDEAFQRLLAAIRGEAPGPPLMTVYKIKRDAEYWERLPKKNKTGALYAGEKLRQAKELAKQEGDKLAPVARDFLSASQEDERRRLREATNRMYKVITGLAVGLIAVTVLAVIALGQRDLARSAALKEQGARLQAEAAEGRERDARREAEAARDDAQRAAENERKARQAETEQREEAEKQTVLAQQQRREAIKQQERAEAQTRIAVSRQLAASAVSEMSRDPEAGLRLARASWQRADTSEGEQALRLSVAESRVRAIMRGSRDRLAEAVYSPDSQTVATVCVDGSLALWDAHTGVKKFDLVAHTGSVEAVVFSPDGKSLATASADGLVVLWDATTGRERVALDNSHGRALSAIFSRDGRLLVTGYHYGGPKIWDAQTGVLLKELPGGSFGTYAFAISHNGETLAGAFGNGTVHTWRTSDWEPLKILNGHNRSRRVSGVSFSHDDKLILTASTDRTVRVWDASTGAQKLKLTFSGEEVADEEPKRERPPGSDNLARHEAGTVFPVEQGLFTASFSPDGKLILTADQGTVLVWDAETGKRVSSPKGHDYLISSASFSPDGRYVLTSGLDNVARVWRASDGERAFELRGHTDPVLSARFSPDGESIVTASADKTARVWTAGRGEVRHALPGHKGGVTNAEFSADGRLALTAVLGGTAHVWDARTGGKITSTVKQGEGLLYAAFDPSGRRIVTLSEADDAPLTIWDSRTGRVLQTLESVPEGESSQTEGIMKAVFSPDGKLVATVFDDVVVVWDARTGKVKARTEDHYDGVSDFAFSPDSRRLVTADGNMSTAHVWDARTGKAVLNLEGNFGAVVSVNYSPDNRYIVTTGDDLTARIWSASTGKELSTLTGHGAKVVKAQFSPDSRYLLTTSIDGTVRVWDVRTGANVVTSTEGKPQLSLANFYPGGIPFPLTVFNEWGISGASFSPDGKLVLISKPDGTLRVFDIHSKRSLSVFGRHTGPVSSAAFSPDGRSILAAGLLDDDAFIYRCEVCGTRDELLRKSEGQVMPEMTAAVRGQAVSAFHNLSFAPNELPHTRLAIRRAIDLILRSAASDSDDVEGMNSDSKLTGNLGFGRDELKEKLFPRLGYAFSIKLPDAQTGGLQTVGDLYAYVESQLRLKRR